MSDAKRSPAWFDTLPLDFRWCETLGPPDCPYVIRWVFDFWLFSFRVHHWLRSDDTRHAHDHEWDFLSLVLSGWLIDRTATGDERRNWLSIKFFRAEHQHMVVVEEPTWTLLLTGPKRRIWGYWVNGRFRKRNKYFHIFGHHDPCGGPARRDA